MLCLGDLNRFSIASSLSDFLLVIDAIEQMLGDVVDCEKFVMFSNWVDVNGEDVWDNFDNDMLVLFYVYT